MKNMILACCKLYISESRNKAALESIERVAKLVHDTKVVNKVEDETYNRVGYTLVSKLPPKLSLDLCPLKDTAFAMVSTALKAIDFNMHGGSHPRLGVVDHICFHHWPVLLWSRQLILQGPWPKMLAPSLKFLPFYMEQHMKKDKLLIQEEESLATLGLTLMEISGREG